MNIKVTLFYVEYTSFSSFAFSHLQLICSLCDLKKARETVTHVDIQALSCLYTYLVPLKSEKKATNVHKKKLSGSFHLFILETLLHKNFV